MNGYSALQKSGPKVYMLRYWGLNVGPSFKGLGTDPTGHLRWRVRGRGGSPPRGKKTKFISPNAECPKTQNNFVFCQTLICPVWAAFRANFLLICSFFNLDLRLARPKQGGFAD